MKEMKKLITVFVSLIILLFYPLSAQEVMGGVKLLVRPAKADSIMLRYAPTDKETWKLANRYGYSVERYTILRDGELVEDREYRLLTEMPLKPQPLENWEQYQDDRYVSIAAECIFGESVVPLVSPVSIARRYKEEQNKYSFALFAADQSPLTARLSGLSCIDKDVKKNEKYVYRVRIAAPDSIHTDTAFAFTGLSEYMPLPKPLDLTARWEDKQVMLSWDIISLQHIYNSYIIERSTDGKNYTSVSDNASVQAADEGLTPDRAYRTDTYSYNNTLLYYRIRGKNAFGETGEPSDSVVGQGRMVITQAPVILNKQTIDNRQVRLDWEFPQKMNDYITGFKIYRSSNPEKTKEKIYEGHDPQERTFTDNDPALTNYYIVSVYDGRTEKFSTGLSYVELIDSTPPLAPTGVMGEVDTLGVVRIKWAANTDKDIKGYRVFRSNNPDHEFMNIHPAVLMDTSYTDTININTLTKNVYYKIKAIDLRENQSALSEVLQLKRPDKIPPVTPVIKDVTAEKDRVMIVWYNSSSEDVVLHRIYRSSDLEDSIVEIATVPMDVPSKTGTYTDRNVMGGEIYTYQIIAEDDSKLRSPYSSAVSIRIQDEKKLQEITLKAKRETEKVLLTWVVDSRRKVERMLIYKAVNNGQLRLFNSTSENNFTDNITDFGESVRYRVKAMYTDGTSSDFSKEVKIN
jgi:fibronectin type 3 domain-containing protein